ncbi:hypothetical protein B0A49_09632 [Cryomyces minteri]|uniref:J domain-containing protein n=1 Tax=Cryomyces minteri TaxID=331657 RepID=A0A4U0W3D7_9PEZI|nr:hypothetical protein B0A49_09632 [Cryomyces minteri]
MSSPDYYKILEIDPKATQQQVRDAYKKQALKHHPDRVAADSPERPKRTRKFQQINDAYYTLSDPSRRRDYDSTRQFHSGGFGSNFGFGSSSAPGPSDDEYEIPRPPPDTSSSSTGGSSFPWSAFGFGGRAKTEADANTFSSEQFGNVFEEMLREEGMAEGEHAAPTSKFWALIGGVSGGAMGFIIANLPGAVAGAVAGNRLGAVRDSRGKSVYSVFQELEQPQKMQLLSELAKRVFAHAIS